MLLKLGWLLRLAGPRLRISMLAIGCCLACAVQGEDFSAADVRENAGDSVDIKLPFDGSNIIIGATKAGQANDAQLKPLRKYRLRLNAGGGYDLLLVGKTKEKQLSALEVPVTLSSQGGPLYFGSHWYPGRISVEDSSTGRLAIDHVSRETALRSLLAPMVSVDDSAEAVKAAAVILRSSLACLQMTLPSGEPYHFNGDSVGYIGIDGRKRFVDDLIAKTRREILIDAHGKLSCTPFRISAVPGSYPFLSIGYRTQAWEKSLGLEELERKLMASGYNPGVILSVRRVQATANPEGHVLLVEGSASSLEMSMFEARRALGLPSRFFRVYSFRDANGDPVVQFLGSLPDGLPRPVNLVKMIYLMADPSLSYEQILAQMYPGTYVARIL